MNNKNNELFDKHNNIPSLWKDLGVTESYKVTFVNIVSELDLSVRKEYFEHEIRSLSLILEILNVRLIYNNLKNISKEIISREKAITLLKKFSEYLKNNDFTDKILQDVVVAVKNYRVLCINIVNNYKKIREICSYQLGVKKYNQDEFLKIFGYDKYYLVKVNLNELFNTR